MENSVFLNYSQYERGCLIDFREIFHCDNLSRFVAYYVVTDK